MSRSTIESPQTLQDSEISGSGELASLKLALVVPTLCEAGNIGRLLGQIKTVLDEQRVRYEVLVVDDDSRDGTADVVGAVAENDPRVRLIVRKGERGLAGAVLDGWRHSDADVLGVIDADFQHPPELLPQLFAAIAEGRDLAIGSRYTPGGELGGWNPFRKLLSAAAVWATWPLQRRRVRAKDPMSGYFMVRRASVQQIDFQRTGFKLLLEILVRARLKSVKEIPFAFGRRYRGASKANLRVAWDYGCLLARLYAGKYGFSRSTSLGVGLEH
ncbi:MAG TPA: polyprenol monophosphomannose synthase [Terracidiphilus sp.]|jgi:dolichol-phosphate mannosyltransferase